MNTRFPYQIISDELRTRIQQGGYGLQRLPSERSLMAEFNVQRDTIRHALHLLQDEGVLMQTATGARYPVNVPTLSPDPTSNLALVVRRGKVWSAPHDMLRGFSPVVRTTTYAPLWIDEHCSPLENPSVSVMHFEMRERSVIGAAYWPEWPFQPNTLRSFQNVAPLVLVDRHVPGVEAHFVGQDDLQGAMLLTQHLIGLGHRRIGFIATDPYVEGIGERLHGYLQALDEAGIVPRAEWVYQCDNTLGLPMTILRSFLISGEEPFTALMCSDDILACQIIAVLRDLGRQTPDDMAVVGFGNIIAPVSDTVGLTTVGIDFEELGRIAAEILLQALKHEGNGYQEINIPMRLTVRRSCGSATTTNGSTLEIWKQ